MHYNILVTGTSSYGVGEGILKIIAASRYRQQIHLIGASNSDLCAYKDLVDEYLVLPNANADNYLPELQRIINEKAINILIPGSEAEMGVLSPYREKLECDVWVNDGVLIDIFNNKKSASQFFMDNGISTPQEYKELEGIKYPVIIKPVYGKSSEGIFRADDVTTLKAIVEYHKCINREFIIQQYIKYDAEYTVSVIHTHGHEYQLVMERTLNKGATQRSFVVEDAKLNGFVSEIAKSISKQWKEFLINIQFVIRGDDMYVLEINPRFSGSAPMRAALGYNEFDILFCEKMMGVRPEYIISTDRYCIRGYCEKSYKI